MHTCTALASAPWHTSGMPLSPPVESCSNGFPKSISALPYINELSQFPLFSQGLAAAFLRRCLADPNEAGLGFREGTKSLLQRIAGELFMRETRLYFLPPPHSSSPPPLTFPVLPGDAITASESQKGWAVRTLKLLSLHPCRGQGHLPCSRALRTPCSPAWDTGRGAGPARGHAGTGGWRRVTLCGPEPMAGAPARLRHRRVPTQQREAFSGRD